VAVRAYTLPSGTYSSQTAPGEPIPYGLAAFVWNIEKVPQYDGTHGVVAVDPQTGQPAMSDPCPVGTNLCLSGGLPEYATMNSQVQAVSYDLMTCHVDITVGVASHLGGGDMIERLRINRGPRWLYEIGFASTGTNGTVMGGPTQLKDTQPAAAVPNYMWLPWSATADGSTTPAALFQTGQPGMTLDTRPVGQPNYGTQPTTSGVAIAGYSYGTAGSGTAGSVPPPGAPSGATIHLQAATPTQSGPMGCVRISASDAAGAGCWIHEYPVCWDFGDGEGPVNAYALLLGSKPYHNSGNPTGG
jgi:hypothetical protein